VLDLPFAKRLYVEKPSMPKSQNVKFEFSFVWKTFVVICLLLASCFPVPLAAQEFSDFSITDENRAEVYKALVADLKTQLLGEDLRKSTSALQVLRSMKESLGWPVRYYAEDVLEEFDAKAKTWLRANAEGFDKFRGKGHKLFDLGFTNPDLEIGKLVYLHAVKLGSVAFVDIPNLKDEHLFVLNGQNELVSLTLERTGVTGLGFRHTQLPSLQVIFFTGSPVDDLGLRVLNRNRYPKLEHIVAKDTQVTANGSKFLLQSHRNRGTVSLRVDR